MTKTLMDTAALYEALKLVGAASNIPALPVIVQALYTTINNAKETAHTDGYKQGYKDSEADKAFAVHMEANFGISEPIVGFAGETIDDADLQIAAAMLDGSEPIGEVTTDRVNAQVEGFADPEYKPLPV